MGRLAYFIEFLNLTGLWSRWVEACPLSYASPNAPTKADVLGTWMLSVLSGHKRYSHVTAIRCDGVNPGFLGMNKVISEDALRNALKRIPQGQGCAGYGSCPSRPGFSPAPPESQLPAAQSGRNTYQKPVPGGGTSGTGRSIPKPVSWCSTRKSPMSDDLV